MSKRFVPDSKPVIRFRVQRVTLLDKKCITHDSEAITALQGDFGVRVVVDVTHADPRKPRDVPFLFVAGQVRPFLHRDEENVRRRVEAVNVID